jgi:hypothetical protein
LKSSEHVDHQGRRSPEWINDSSDDAIIAVSDDGETPAESLLKEHGRLYVIRE